MVQATTIAMLSTSPKPVNWYWQQLAKSPTADVRWKFTPPKKAYNSTQATGSMDLKELTELHSQPEVLSASKQNSSPTLLMYLISRLVYCNRATTTNRLLSINLV